MKISTCFELAIRMSIRIGSRIRITITMSKYDLAS
jgi:hypothetical protein